MKHFNKCHQSMLSRTNLLIYISLFILPFCLSAQTQDNTNNAGDSTPYELVRLDWEGKAISGSTLVLDNRWGDIHLRQTGGDIVTFHAVMQKIGERPKTGELKVEQSEDKITLLVSYPEDQRPDNVKDGRVDAALLVPFGVNIEVLADRGKVSSKTMESRIKVTAVDQLVSLKSASSVDIDSRAGEIDIQFIPRAEGDSYNGRGRIKTILGDINIRYYPDMAIRFEMLSGRSKTTNDLELLRNRELTGRYVNMHTGVNPETLTLQSDTGYIRLINTGSEVLLNSPN